MNQHHAIQQTMRAWAEGEKSFLAHNQWLPPRGENTIDLLYPTDLSNLTRYRFCSPADVDEAVASARAAFDKGEFRQMPLRQRAGLLRQLGQVIRDHAAELAVLETLCNGKLYQSEALQDDLPDCADVFDYYAGWADKHQGEVIPTNPGALNYTLNEPYGVCALIVPWNFPLLLTCWKLSCALITGNTVVIKPSEYTPLSLIYFLEQVLARKLLPQGLINMVLGDGAIGDYLVHHRGVDKVSFTGSTATGRRIVEASAASNLKTVSLELGGKSPNIIFADSKDIDKISDHQFVAMFCHKGEKCSEPSRLLVEKAIYNQVVDRLVQRCQQQRLGDPFLETSQQGPQCFQQHFDRVMGYIQSGISQGATLLAGGEQDMDANQGKGLFIRPTLFADVSQEMRIVQEEIFGPVLTVQAFSDEDEAVHLANGTPYGLAAGFYTQDMNRCHRLTEKLAAGMIFINRYGMYEFASPFGGFKQSGWGKEMGWHSLKAFTRCKSVWMKFS